MASTNVIFLHSHNTGRYVQPYGWQVPTANLQRLANEGVLFRKGFAAAPTCTPSRTAFLTGMCPHSAGTLGLAHRGFGPPDARHHIGTFLQKHGYHTAKVGVEHLANHQSVQDVAGGYDEVMDTENCRFFECAAEARKFFHRQRASQDNGGKPFFISIGFNETHTPWPWPEPQNNWAEDERYCQPFPPIPDTPEARRETAMFKAAARQMDQGFGYILDALEETSLADNTLIFAFADHGLQMSRHMCNLTDAGLEIYFIARGPRTGPGAALRGGLCEDAMVSLMDMFPTVCDVIGVDQPDWLEGKSLLPLARKEVSRLHDQLFGEVTYHAAYEPMRSVRTERYKYIRRYDNREKLVLPNTDDARVKTRLLAEGWNEQPREQEMFFDLMFDPQEQNNIISRPDVQAHVTDLKDRLAKWMDDTSDPMRAGKVDPPPGSKFNDVDGYSPNDKPQVAPAAP